MSVSGGYKNYDEVAAAAYVASRVPVGVQIVFGAFASTARPLAEMILLDAGCGVGLYTAPIALRVAHVLALDRSDAMLAQARAQGDAHGATNVTFLTGSIESMPVDDCSVDGVLINQVLHHLETGLNPRFPGHRRAIAEAYRVLKPGGVLVVNACTHLQLQRGFWYYSLIPRARDASLQRCASSSALSEMLMEARFNEEERIVPLKQPLLGASHFESEGPLHARWREADSIWSLVSPEELASAKATCNRLSRSGRLGDYMHAHDAERLNVGQCTFFIASKRRSRC